MPVLYCLTPLPTLVLHYYDTAPITGSVRNNCPPNTSDNMLDAFFAGRRRPACAPPPSVAGAPTVSPYTSEELIGMYTARSPVAPPPDGVYVPSNRSSYSPGEARKSLLAYMDADSYAYSDAGARSRPVSVVVAKGAAPPSRDALAAPAAASDSAASTTTATNGASDRLPDARTPRSAAAQQHQHQHQGFLASVWALGRYLSVATASSAREVVNDVVTMAAGFKREKRSYAASVGSSANMDDFVGSEEGESVTEEEGDSEEEDEDSPYRPDTIDKGKSREILAGYQPGGPSGRELARGPTPSPPSTATETVVADHRPESETETETVVPAVASEVEAMPSADRRPMLERHQSRSQTELRPSHEEATVAPRRSPSLADLKDVRQDDIREMLRESVTAAEAAAAAPGPVLVTELPAPEPVDAEEPTPEPAPFEILAREEDAVPETPPKSPLRNRSASGSPSSSHHEFAPPEVAQAVEPVEEEEEGKVEAEKKTADEEKEEMPAAAAEAAEEAHKERTVSNLKEYSQALSSMLLNPAAHSTVVEAPETATAEIGSSSAPAISAEALVEAPKPASIDVTDTAAPTDATDAAAPIDATDTAAPEGRQFPAAEFADTLVSSPLLPIAEAKEEKREPVKVEESPRKISADSKVSAFTEAGAVRTATPETKTEEKPVEKAEEKPVEKAEEKAEKAASITNAPGGLERRKSNAFRRDTLQRSLSMFRKKDKNKSKDSNELPAATSSATTSAVELTPPPTPPHTDEQGDKGSTPTPAERVKPASRMSMFSTVKALKEKAAKESSAAKNADGDSAAAAPSGTPASPEKPELKKRSSFISIAESFRSQRPSTSAGMLTTTKEGEDEPKTPQRRSTFRPFSSSGDKPKLRAKTWFGGEKKPKVNDKGELVDPNATKDDGDAPASPENASSIALSFTASTREASTPATPVPETPTKESKPKFFRSPSIKRASTFGLANRSLSSSAVSMGTTDTAATDATGATATDSPTKSKGAARMKGLVRSGTLMGMSKRKDKGKGKDSAAE